MPNTQEVVLRSPEGEEVRTSDPNEIQRYEEQGYERVESDQQ